MNLDDFQYDSDEIDRNDLSPVSLENLSPLPHQKNGRKLHRISLFYHAFLVVNICFFFGNLSFSGMTWSKIRTIKKYCPDPPYCM
jgi:hypothetical protein